MARNRTTPPSERELLGSCQDWLRANLPTGWSLTEKERPRGSAPELTGVFEMASPEGTSSRIAVSARAKIGPRDVVWVLDQLRAENEAPPFLLLARYLSPRVREMIEDRGASFWDATGNARIALDRPGLLIKDRGGTSDPWRGASGKPESLRGLPAARVVRALADLESPWRMRDLAKESGTSLGSTARTVEVLEREGLVGRDKERRISQVKWAEMIRLWTEEYQLFDRRARVGRFIALRGLPEAVEKIKGSGLDYALSGSLAAQR